MRLCCGANGAFRENLDGVMRCVTFFFFWEWGEVLRWGICLGLDQWSCVRLLRVVNG